MPVKNNLKEKFEFQIESILAGNNVSALEQESFWFELFVLQVKEDFIRSEFAKYLKIKSDKPEDPKSNDTAAKKDSLLRTFLEVPDKKKSIELLLKFGVKTVTRYHFPQSVNAVKIMLIFLECLFKNESTGSKALERIINDENDNDGVNSKDTDSFLASLGTAIQVLLDDHKDKGIWRHGLLLLVTLMTLDKDFKQNRIIASLQRNEELFQTLLRNMITDFDDEQGQQTYNPFVIPFGALCSISIPDDKNNSLPSNPFRENLKRLEGQEGEVIVKSLMITVHQVLNGYILDKLSHKEEVAHDSSFLSVLMPPLLKFNPFTLGKEEAPKLISISLESSLLALQILIPIVSSNKSFLQFIQSNGSSSGPSVKEDDEVKSSMTKNSSEDVRVFEPRDLFITLINVTSLELGSRLCSELAKSCFVVWRALYEHSAVAEILNVESPNQINSQTNSPNPKTSFTWELLEILHRGFLHRNKKFMVMSVGGNIAVATVVTILSRIMIQLAIANERDRKKKPALMLDFEWNVVFSELLQLVSLFGPLIKEDEPEDKSNLPFVIVERANVLLRDKKIFISCLYEILQQGEAANTLHSKYKSRINANQRAFNNNLFLINITNLKIIVSFFEDQIKSAERRNPKIILSYKQIRDIIESNCMRLEIQNNSHVKYTAFEPLSDDDVYYPNFERKLITLAQFLKQRTLQP